MIGIAYVESPMRSETLSTVCQGYSQEMVMTLYHTRTATVPPIVAYLCLSLAQLGNVAQFAIYTVIYAHLWRNDKQMVSVLPESTLKTRRRRNAIDITGHMLFTLLTCLMTVTMLLGSYWMTSSRRLWTMMAFKATYGIWGICHIVSSPPMRLQFMNCLKAFPRMVAFWSRRNTSPTTNPAPAPAHAPAPNTKIV